MKASIAASIVSGFATLAGCGLAAHQSSEERADAVGTQVQGLDITEHDSDSLLGTFISQHGSIAFEAHAAEPDHADLVFTINGKTLSYEALSSTQQHDGWYRVVADIVIEERDRALAGEALAALVDSFGDDLAALSLFEASVPKMTSFLSGQRAGSLVPSIARSEYGSARTVNKRLDDDATVCIKKNTTVTANYDKGRSGAAYAVSVVVGSDWKTSACGSGNYACMGRCGSGCSGFGGAWTLDCLDHDACSHDLCASGGSGDANCGDEYSQAQSEIFAGCRG